MATAAHDTDGTRFVAKRARKWLSTSSLATEAVPTQPVIDLRHGELDRATAPHIVEAAAAALSRGETHYTSRPGILPLRRAISAMMARESGIEYNPTNEVLIASGGQEGLFVAVQMLVQPGDDVLLADPSYASYREAIRLAGGNLVPVPVSALDQYGMTAAALAARVTSRTRVLILVSPDNPTGGVTMGGEMERIAAFAVAHDLSVLFDETYKAFVFDGATHTRIATFPGMRARTVIVGSFSKTYAMTGWRVGYVVAAAERLEPITDLKLALSICSAAPSQWAAAAALEGPQEHVQEALAEVARRRAVLLPALAAMGLPHGDPQGAYYAFADIRGTGLSSGACADLFLRQAGVRTLPGDRFGPGGEGFLRFSLVQPVPAIAEAMGRLAPLVRELQSVHEGGSR
jgi:aminotransferase